MGNVLLVLGQLGVQILVESLAQILDDESGISNLLSIELDEWQLTFLGSVLHLVIDILKQEQGGGKD